MLFGLTVSLEDYISTVYLLSFVKRIGFISGI